MTAQSQIAGFTSANIAEVEQATKALRVTLRAEDYGALGIYSVGNVSGIMAAGIAANSPIFSFRWGNASNLALVKRIMISGGCDTVAFAAGTFSFSAFVARSFSANDTAGTNASTPISVPTSNQNKLRTSGMGSSLLTDVRMSNTATLVAGTRTLDTNPVGSLVGGMIAAAAGTPFFSQMMPLWDQRPGEHPLILAQNEGIIIQCVMPATGTWKFGVKMDWTEIAAY